MNEDINLVMKNFLHIYPAKKKKKKISLSHPQELDFRVPTSPTFTYKIYLMKNFVMNWSIFSLMDHILSHIIFLVILICIIGNIINDMV